MARTIETLPVEPTLIACWSALARLSPNAGVTRYAAWVHETDRLLRSDLERRGYTLDEVTRAMGMALDDIRAPRPEVELGPADWSEHLRIAEVNPGLLSGLDAAAFHVLVGRQRVENVVTGIAFHRSRG